MAPAVYSRALPFLGAPASLLILCRHAARDRRSWPGKRERTDDRRPGDRPTEQLRLPALSGRVACRHLTSAYYVALGDEGAVHAEPLHLFTRGHMSLPSLGLGIFFVVSGFLVTESFERRQRVPAYLKARALRSSPRW